MNYKTLKDNLETYALAAGIKTYRFGYVEEINILREKDKSVLYPVMLVVPPTWKVNVREKHFLTELNFFIINDLTKASRTVATREESWDYIHTLAVAFIGYIDQNTGLSSNSPLTAIPYPQGITVNDDIGVEFTVTIKVIC